MFDCPMLPQKYIANPKKVADGSQHCCNFFPTGRERPDVHSLVPELKGFYDLTYNFRRQLDFTAVRPPCLNRQNRQKIAQDLSHRRGLYFVNEPFGGRNESTDK